ncbi:MULTISPECIES: hypothetical protein [Kribbella]|uniref:hypothetical protein n=1 Tax=Kribbella TaxID=182639 RepID=UPI0018EE4840|nr:MULTISPECIES: hypothetical protein [Kribbella]
MAGTIVAIGTAASGEDPRGEGTVHRRQLRPAERPRRPNPTLTSQALATRTAEKICETYFGGDPWVRTGSPVASTDPRISVRLGQLGL